MFANPYTDLHERQESPSIDAGDPADPVGDEPAPNGGRINQGAYGGTSEATISSEARILSLIDAASNGWIGLYCHTWDGIEYEHISGQGETSLPSWTGFWVEVYRDLDLLFPPTAGQPSPPGTMTYTVDSLRYYLISSPLVPVSGDQGAVFGDDIGGSPETEWRVSKYDYQTGTYQRYTGTGSIPEVIPGRGFWLYLNIDIEEQKTLTVTGAPADQSRNYDLKLPATNGQRTFHMVGNPFPYGFRWSDVKVRIPMTAGLPLGKIARASIEQTVTWYIGLELADSKGTCRDTFNRAGVIESGPDYHTVLSTPDLGSASSENIQLALRDPDEPGRGLLAYDYRQPGRNEYRWRIELTATMESVSTVLSLKNLASVPPEYAISLTDEATGETMAVSSDISFPVTLSASSPRTFSLTATDIHPTAAELPAPSKFGITRVSPNPFNPSTVIGFSLERPGHARVSVYSMTGQRIRILADARMAAGDHTVSWHAAGCASGVYLVTVESGGRLDSRKITLMK